MGSISIASASSVSMLLCVWGRQCASRCLYNSFPSSAQPFPKRDLTTKALIRRTDLGNRQITGPHILHLREEQQPIVALCLFLGKPQHFGLTESTNQKPPAYGAAILQLSVVFQPALVFTAHNADFRCAERFQQQAVALDHFGNRCLRAVKGSLIRAVARFYDQNSCHTATSSLVILPLAVVVFQKFQDDALHLFGGKALREIALDL